MEPTTAASNMNNPLSFLDRFEARETQSYDPHDDNPVLMPPGFRRVAIAAKKASVRSRPDDFEDDKVEPPKKRAKTAKQTLARHGEIPKSRVHTFMSGALTPRTSSKASAHSQPTIPFKRKPEPNEEKIIAGWPARLPPSSMLKKIARNKNTVSSMKARPAVRVDNVQEDRRRSIRKAEYGTKPTVIPRPENVSDISKSQSASGTDSTDSSDRHKSASSPLPASPSPLPPSPARPGTHTPQTLVLTTPIIPWRELFDIPNTPRKPVYLEPVVSNEITTRERPPLQMPKPIRFASHAKVHEHSHSKPLRASPRLAALNTHITVEPHHTLINAASAQSSDGDSLSGWDEAASIASGDYIPLVTPVKLGPRHGKTQIQQGTSHRQNQQVDINDHKRDSRRSTPKQEALLPLKKRLTPNDDERNKVITTPVLARDPTIWKIRNTTTPHPQHPDRSWPPLPGTVYCKTCFRDDCTRWLRIRDSVTRAIFLLGGDPVLEELQAAAELAEEQETAQLYGTLPSQRSPLRSPPPTHDGEEMIARKMIVLPDKQTRAANKLFHDNPSDVIGLVLLRVLAQKRLSRLDKAVRDEINRLLVTLRQDIRVSGRRINQLEIRCRKLLDDFDTGIRVETGRQRRGTWQWEFDETLQKAHEELPDSPSSTFRATLRHEAQTVLEKGTTARQMRNIEQTLGLDLPAEEVLVNIGRNVALGRQHPAGKRGDPEAEPDDRGGYINPHIIDLPNTNEGPPLPCVYCAESGSANRRLSAREKADTAGKPWVKALMWTYGMDETTASGLVMEDFLYLVKSRRGLSGSPEWGVPGMKFVVDATRGKTRIVLVDMKSVFEVICDETRAQQGTMVRFDERVGVWERWRDGELWSYNFV